MNSAIQKKILVVDDEEDVRDSISLILDKRLNGGVDYSIITCGNAHEALMEIKENDIDVVISDIKMPGTSGLEMLDQIRVFNKQLPVLLMTAYADLDASLKAIREGAFDFIMKPLHPDYLVHSVNKALQLGSLVKFKEQYKRYLETTVAERTNELDVAMKDASNFSHELIKRLTTVAEFRDTEAGTHVSRIGTYAVMISQKLEMPLEFIRNIKDASPLHDIGKLGVTDHILFKPGQLTLEEYEVMKTHTSEGASILSKSSNPIIQMAESIALTHHERWDGTGYPRGLRGEEIPIEGRIVNICDQYDAIRSKRVYKPEYSHVETVRIITEGDGRTMPEHFDPNVLRALARVADQFDEVYTAYNDHPGGDSK
ncbi:MAG: response regulator [Nitrospirae bacterium]|nr:response regulator [Nitrospirota bacterium]